MGRELFFFFPAEDGIRDYDVTGVQTCALPISLRSTNPPLVVIEEKQIPEAFWKPQPAKLDRQGLLSALKDGLDVPGVALGNGGVTIAVRTK